MTENHTAQQLVFDMMPNAKNAPYHPGDFCVSNSNREAFDYVTRYCPDQWHHHACLLIGPAFSGKQHLMKLWQYHKTPWIIQLSDLAQESFLPTLMNSQHMAMPAHFIGIEWNEDTMKNQTDTAQNDHTKATFSQTLQENLFHIYNMCKNQQGCLLITSQDDITHRDWTLPDLRSRLKSIHKIHIQQPDDALLSQLLLKHFSDRQIQLPPHIFHYILQRMERSYENVMHLVKEIDRVSLSLHKSITIPLIKKAMNW
jgi:chromosomal replication initiation ATPase DnaA